MKACEETLDVAKCIEVSVHKLGDHDLTRLKASLYLARSYPAEGIGVQLARTSNVNHA